MLAAMRGRPFRRTFVVLLALSMVACSGSPSAPKSASPAGATSAVAVSKIDLRPADEARPSLGIVVTSASPEALAAELDAFARDAGLPLAVGQGLLDALIDTLDMELSREQFSDSLRPTRWRS